MTTTSAKIKNSMLALPKTLHSGWENARVAIQGDANTLIVKKRSARAPRRRLSDFAKRMKAAGRGVSVRDISAAIRAVRRERT